MVVIVMPQTMPLFKNPQEFSERFKGFVPDNSVTAYIRLIEE